jgi:hypothetical protein
MMLGSLITSLLPAVTDVVGRFLPADPEKKAAAEREIKSALQSHLAQVDLAQLGVNKVEAASRSVFTSGWRPFIGWTCGSAMAYTYVVQPVLVFALAQSGYLIELPRMDLGELMPVLMGMLGLGGLRSWEKVKGVAK